MSQHKQKRGAVRVRKAWGSSREYAYDDVWVALNKMERDDTMCLLVVNPPDGLTCAKLKRLVEIAAMDYEKLVEIVNATWITQPTDHPKGNSKARAVLDTLGLGLNQRKPRGGRKS